MQLAQPFAKAPLVSPMINVGALQDIPTGTWLFGKHGEAILNGGLSYIEGITGIPNNFKSTFQRFRSMKAGSRMKGSTGSIYDTEINMHEKHQAAFADGMEEFEGERIFDTGRWVLTNKAMHSGNEYYEMQRDYLMAKFKNAKNIMVNTPFLDRDGETLMQIMLPTFSDVDSLSAFETDDVTSMSEEAELGDKKANTIHMKQGLAKTRYLMEAPRLNIMASNYVSMTTHLGKEHAMQQAGPPGAAQPTKILQYLKNGDKIKGAPAQFMTLTHNLWNCYNASPMINQGTKASEYPKTSGDDLNLDTDLNTLQIRNLRSKSGVTGLPLTIIVSQQEGVLPSLSEFHYIKETERYGLEGSNVSYALNLLPEVKLGRTTVRGKIDNDPKLRRALNITSEMCQMEQLWNAGMGDDVKCTPKELYDDLKAQGHDWDLLLSTRGWWTYDNDQHPIPFLSTMDLLNMRKGTYFPFWMGEDKKIKPDYVKKYMS